MNDDDQPQRTPAPTNYWDEWRAREGIVEGHLTPAQYGDELRKRLADKQAKEEIKSQKEVALRLQKKRKSESIFFFSF